MNRWITWVVAGAVLLVLGAGCRDRLASWRPGTEPTTGETRALETLPPAEAAQKIVFMGGDTFEVHSTVFGMGTNLLENTKWKTQPREVTIKRFAPFFLAEFNWALRAIERTEKGNEEVTASGTVSEINLQSAHVLGSPTYWQPGPVSLNGDKSGLWLSDDAYQELDKTGKTALSFGLVDDAANQLFKGLKEVADAFAKLKGNQKVEEKKKEITLLEAEKDPVEVTIKVNGKDVKVHAIRAKNWFGEVLVLKNRHNPLVLKLSVNPVTYGVVAGMNEQERSLKNVFGYEIKNLKVQAAQ